MSSLSVETFQVICTLQSVVEFEILQSLTVEAFRVYLVLCYCRYFGCLIEPCYDLCSNT